MDSQSDLPKPINRIVLVGNGFDISHGFNVSFKSFVEHLILSIIKDFVEKNISRNEFLRIQPRVPSAGQVSFTSVYDDSKPFKKIQEFEDRGTFVVTKSELFKAIEKEITWAGWVDLEMIYFNLLSGYVKSGNKYKTERLNAEMRFLKMELENYLVDECGDLSGRLNQRLLNQMTSKIYGATDITRGGLHNSQKPNQYLFINFNYTNVLRKYFEYLSEPIATESQFIHIHGVLGGDDDSSGQRVVFGFGDEKHQEYLKFEQYQAPKEAYELIKSYKYLEAAYYQNVIRFLELAPYQVSIFGHSCGSSDRTLLRTIFNHDNCYSIKPYYYQDDTGKDDYFEKALAISMCFDDKERFREKVVNKMFCHPMEQTPGFKTKQ